MNRLISLCVALLLSICTLDSFAQKCRFDKDEVDGFTKEHFRLAPPLRICTAPYWWVQMEQKGGKYYFTIQIFVLKEVREIMAKDTKILTKLEDGTIIELVAENEVKPTFNVEQTGYQALIVTQWSVRTSVTEEIVKQFSKSPVSLMRTKIGDNEYNMPEAINRYTSKIMDMAACMLKKD